MLASQSEMGARGQTDAVIVALEGLPRGANNEPMDYVSAGVDFTPYNSDRKSVSKSKRWHFERTDSICGTGIFPGHWYPCDSHPGDLPGVVTEPSLLPKGGLAKGIQRGGAGSAQGRS